MRFRKALLESSAEFRCAFRGIICRGVLELIPTGTGYKVLCEIIKLYAGAEFSYQVKLHLKGKSASRVIDKE